MKKIGRRDFIKKGSVTALAGSSAILLSCSPENKTEGPAVHTRKKYKWRIVTTWAPHFPVLGEGVDQFADWIKEMSEGRLSIQVYGANELVPAFESFEAVRSGVAQMSHGASYYWAGKVPAGQFFSTVPFGMNTQQMNAWLTGGGGLKLWEELYAPFDLIPFPAGNTGMQMGGWFNKMINSISDIQGLKMRIPGLGSKVINKAGGTGLATPGAEIYTNLERGVIDATEWIGPYHDYLKGFHKIARYYYYPGWHEPGTVLELTVNKSAFEGLPNDLQAIIRTAAARLNGQVLAEFNAKNGEYLTKLINEHNVNLQKFPDDVLSAFKNFSEEVIDDLVSSDAKAAKIYESYRNFRKQITGWEEVTTHVYDAAVKA
ncbi:MAG: ABC transporter substrate-binding protein [Calditrichaeota bacterium]|nr:MAG: ABC transporter substrate-binding protein [Calditrichota bacterium]